MNSDQLAEIRPVLREVSEGAPDLCATMQVEGDSKKWMQVVGRTINAAYPHSDCPEQRVAESKLPTLDLKLVCWEAGQFATFELDELEVTEAAEWIDAYFVRVMGCPDGNYHLDVTLQEL